jgi:hypothetical protein
LRAPERQKLQKHITILIGYFRIISVSTRQYIVLELECIGIIISRDVNLKLLKIKKVNKNKNIVLHFDIIKKGLLGIINEG